MAVKTDFAVPLSQFFISRLIDQRQVSVHTIASYKDAFRLLVLYAKQQLHKEPQALSIKDLNVQVVVGFLNHLEQQCQHAKCAAGGNPVFFSVCRVVRATICLCDTDTYCVIPELSSFQNNQGNSVFAITLIDAR